MKWTTILSLWLGIACAACAGTNGTLNSTAIGETECLDDLLDGHIRLRAWGNGLNQLDATQMAQKSAVRDVLFKGVTTGKSNCQLPPVLPAPNVREKNADFFEAFFRDGGDYKKYVQVEKVAGLYRIAGSKQFAAKVQVRVALSTLRKDMQTLKTGK
jgi:hypothetical protein